MGCGAPDGTAERQVLETDSSGITIVEIRLDPEALDAVVEDLAPFCAARVVQPCASVSLVGRGIRAILHQLGPALEVFEEQQVHLVTQAASDLNFSFVVDEEQAPRLVREIHAQFFGKLLHFFHLVLIGFHHQELEYNMRGAGFELFFPADHIPGTFQYFFQLSPDAV